MTYVPMMVFTRPMWQFYLWDIHILTYPNFLMIKSVMQMILIVLEKTVGKSDDVTHCVIYLILILALLNLLEMVTAERLLYVILLFSAWGVLAL
jgi:hypothetical protein